MPPGRASPDRVRGIGTRMPAALDLPLPARPRVDHDDWFDGTGAFAALDRPGWTEELDRLVRALGALPPARTVDLGSGTGYFTRYLRGFLVGVDRDPEMVRLTQERLPEGLAVVGDALRAPFADDVFARAFTGHLYRGLAAESRAALATEARRLGRELVVLDAPAPPGTPGADAAPARPGRTDAAGIAAELDGEVLLDGDWFALVRSRWEG